MPAAVGPAVLPWSFTAQPGQVKCFRMRDALSDLPHRGHAKVMSFLSWLPDFGRGVLLIGAVDDSRFYRGFGGVLLCGCEGRSAGWLLGVAQGLSDEMSFFYCTGCDHNTRTWYTTQTFGALRCANDALPNTSCRVEHAFLRLDLP